MNRLREAVPYGAALVKSGSAMTAALLAATVLLLTCKERTVVPSAAAGRTPPIIIISIDTLRADHLPGWGYRGVETPAIDSLAAGGILFRNAYSQVPLTLPSHVSMLTGLFPADDGVRNNLGYVFTPEKHATIPSLLKEKGYVTGAAVSAYVLRGETGLSGAFDSYDDRMPEKLGEAVGQVQRPGTVTESIAESWISSRKDSPFFYMLHLFEPHTPYSPPEPFRSRYRERPYDGEIAAADAVVGRFLEFLKKQQIYDRSLIVLMSDHGEGLGDHGEQEHGVLLYREAIHVPLIIKLPAGTRAGTIVDDPVMLVDLMPTVAELVGADPPPGLRGVSLLRVAGGEVPSRRSFSETIYPRVHLGWSALQSLIDLDYHYIEAPRPELYDLTRDRAEKTNVLQNERRVYARFRREIAPLIRPLEAPSAISAEEAAKLAALGYLGSTAGESSGPLPDPKDRIADVELLKEASLMISSGRLPQAIEALQGLVKRNPQLTDGWSILGKAYAEAGLFEKAAEAYERHIALAPQMAAETALSLSSVFLSLGDLRRAGSYADLALEAYPGPAHLRLGRIALAKEDFATAQREAESAMRSVEYRVPAKVLLAKILVRQKRLEEALSLVNEARAEVRSGGLDPVPQLEYVRGDVLARLKRMDQAAAAFQEEIRHFPRDRQPYANLAVIYLLEGKKGRATEVMENLVKANPTRESYLLAAETFARLGEASAARRWRERSEAAAR